MNLFPPPLGEGEGKGGKALGKSILSGLPLPLRVPRMGSSLLLTIIAILR